MGEADDGKSERRTDMAHGICHVKDEYDYRFVCDKREELFDHLKECYFNLMNENLPIFGVPGKVKEFSTSKKDI